MTTYDYDAAMASFIGEIEKLLPGIEENDDYKMFQDDKSLPYVYLGCGLSSYLTKVLEKNPKADGSQKIFLLLDSAYNGDDSNLRDLIISELFEKWSSESDEFCDIAKNNLHGEAREWFTKYHYPKK